MKAACKRHRTSMVMTIVLLAAALLCVASAQSPRTGQTKPIDYASQVRPILAEKCFTCHGLDEKKRQAGLRLDKRTSAVGMNASGHPAILPGKPAESRIIGRVTAAGAQRMPPRGVGSALTPN